MKPHTTTTETIVAGKFLKLECVNFIDDCGIERKWEVCNRENSTGAAVIIATIVPNNELIIIRQFRPATGKFMIEFPAGLIDPGEDAKETAIRELKEETGYVGVVTRVLPPSNSSPGMSGETMEIVEVEIDGSKYDNVVPEPELEDSEIIETFRVPSDEISDFLTDAIANGDGVDSKLLSFSLGLKNNL